MVDYDLIIIGSGPAGMNACLYATRSNLSTLVIEKNYPGGKVVKANLVENYLGTDSVSGPDLALSMFKHSFSYGGVYEQGNVLDIIDYDNYKEVILESKKYRCYAVIIAIGTSERKLGIPGEEKFYGKGVSYCALCDASLYKNKDMVVIGNSDYALEETLYLTKFASKVYIINGKDNFNANNELVEKIISNDKIAIINNSSVLSINGEKYVTSITVKNSKENKEIKTSVVFPFIGSSPDSMFTSRLRITDDKNYIVVNEKQETKIKGIYSAGDCTNKPLKQIISASGDGAVAATEAYKYIMKIKKVK